MVMPSGMRSSAPTPPPSASGKSAEQRRHGRHDDGPEAQQAGLEDRLFRGLAFFPLRLQRKVDHHDGVLLHDADEQDDADERNDAELNPESMSASSAPTPADGSVEMIVMGWM